MSKQSRGQKSVRYLAGEDGAKMETVDIELDGSSRPTSRADSKPLVRQDSGISVTSEGSEQNAAAGLKRLGYSDDREFSNDSSMAMFPLIGFAIPDLRPHQSAFKLNDPIISMTTPEFDLEKKLLHMKTARSLVRVKKYMSHCKIKLSDLLERSYGLIDGDGVVKTAIPLGLILEDAQAIDTKIIKTIQRLGVHISHNAVWVRRRIQHILFSLETHTPELDPDTPGKQPTHKENEYIKILLIERHKRMEERILSLSLELSGYRNNQGFNDLSPFEHLIKKNADILRNENSEQNTARIKPQEENKLKDVISIMKLYNHAYAEFIDKFHLKTAPKEPSKDTKDLMASVIEALDSTDEGNSSMGYMQMKNDSRCSESHLQAVSELVWGFLIERFELLWCNVFTFFQLIAGPCYSKIEKLTEKFMRQAIFSCMSHAFKLHKPPPQLSSLKKKTSTETISNEKMITEAFKSIRGVFFDKSNAMFLGISPDSINIEKFPVDAKNSFLNKIRAVLHENTVPIRLNYEAVLHDLTFNPIYSNMEQNMKELEESCSGFVDKVIKEYKWKPKVNKKCSYEYVSDAARDKFIKIIRANIPNVSEMGLEACRLNVYSDPSVAALITLRALNQSDIESSLAHLRTVWNHPFVTGVSIKSDSGSEKTIDKGPETILKTSDMKLATRPGWAISEISEDIHINKLLIVSRGDEFDKSEFYPSKPLIWDMLVYNSATPHRPKFRLQQRQRHPQQRRNKTPSKPRQRKQQPKGAHKKLANKPAFKRQYKGRR